MISITNLSPEGNGRANVVGSISLCSVVCGKGHIEAFHHGSMPLVAVAKANVRCCSLRMHCANCLLAQNF